jgi:hypothetical protein
MKKGVVVYRRCNIDMKSKSVESYTDILGATSSTVDGSPAEKNKGERISNGLPDIRFFLSTRKRGRASPVCCVCG